MKNKNPLMIVSLMILFMGISVATTTVETESVERETAAMLSGNVIDAETDELIPDAVVTLEELGHAATTDENGRFVFEVEAGDYTLLVEAEGYADHKDEVSVPQEGTHVELEIVREN